MKTLMKTIVTAAFLMLTLGLTACHQEGPAERAGESVDNTMTDMGNSVEDACEDVKEGVGAKDTDC